MAPKTTTWHLDEHTKGKHFVLEHYMNAWLPIMTSRNVRVLFIDAFAGPGEYSNGEPGSPIIALQCLANHSALDRMNGNIVYLFIEQNAERANHLEETLKNIDIPKNCDYEVINSTFDETLNKALDSLEEQRKRLAPAFVMIDPFGVKETPMQTINRILQNPKSEVYISFMYRDINRFKNHPNFESHLDNLFGCPEWRQGNQMADSKKRQEFMFDLYQEQLRKSGAKYVLHFDLYEGNRLVYAIFFGTQNLEGCDKMKQAIWKADPNGSYKFRSGQKEQLAFGVNMLDFKHLENALKEEFGIGKWVNISDIEDFVKSDKTPFHSSHLKTNTLVPMENRGEIEIYVGSRKRAKTYPKGTRLKFV